MATTASPLLHGWRFGLHPRAVGMRLAAIGRVELPLGEALRIEFASDPPGSPETGDVQYYISTQAGPWALWLSCPRDELEAGEAALHRLEYPLT